MFNMKTKLPLKIDYFNVAEDGLLSRDGATMFTWIDEAGFVGGHVRYRLVAEDVSQEEFNKVLNSVRTQ
jgi:hypothetical protein